MTVALILAAAALQALTGQPFIPVSIALAASQLLLVFAVRPFERYLVLILISFLLLPVSIAIVAGVIGFADDLPRILQLSPVWAGVIAFFALSVELFIHWQRAGRNRGLSIWRIWGTFSIAISAGALLLLLAVSALPAALIPNDGLGWRLVQHILRFRAGALLVWLAYVVLLSLPTTFNYAIDVKSSPGRGPLAQSIFHIVALARGVIVNFGLAIREGARDIVLLCRTAIEPVMRRILFLASVVAWQVAFSLLIDSYLSYLVDREVHALQLGPAAFLAATSPIIIFWTLIRARLMEVIGVAIRTVILTGALLTLCAAVASLLWWAYELLSDRRDDVNVLGVVSIGIIVLAALTGFARKEK